MTATLTKIYRICPLQFANNFTGLGASYQRGARWNPKGYQVMYFALSPSVAMLEMANYLPSPLLVPKSYRLVTYHIGQGLIDNFTASLPENWADYPHPIETQQIGELWLQGSTNVCLKVPSAATPNGMESILLFNCAHPKANELTMVESTDKLFNKRAFQGLTK